MSGHSFSASDRDSALIEKRPKCSKIQTVEDVKTVISLTRPSRPYRVLDMSEKFLDFDKASSRYIDKSKLGITQVSCLRMSKDNPGLIMYKINHFRDIMEWNICRVLKRGTTIQDIVSAQLEGLPVVQSLTDSKQKDLRTMLEFIDEENRKIFIVL